MESSDKFGFLHIVCIGSVVLHIWLLKQHKIVCLTYLLFSWDDCPPSTFNLLNTNEKNLKFNVISISSFSLQHILHCRTLFGSDPQGKILVKKQLFFSCLSKWRAKKRSIGVFLRSTEAKLTEGFEYLRLSLCFSYKFPQFEKRRTGNITQNLGSSKETNLTPPFGKTF